MDDQANFDALLLQITLMRERTDQLLRGALQTCSADDSIIAYLEMIHRLFCAIEAQRRSATVAFGGTTPSPEDIEQIAEAVARKLGLGAYMPEKPRRRPSRPS